MPLAPNHPDPAHATVRDPEALPAAGSLPVGALPAEAAAAYCSWQQELPHGSRSRLGSMVLRRSRIDEHTQLWTVAGALDAAAAPPLGRLLTRAGGAGVAVVLDLAALDFLAIAGLEVLATAGERCAAHRCGMLALSGPGRHARRALRLAGLDTCLPIRAQPGDALTALAAPAGRAGDKPARPAGSRL